MSKGSNRRPRLVDAGDFDRRWEETFKRSPEVPHCPWCKRTDGQLLWRKGEDGGRDVYACPFCEKEYGDGVRLYDADSKREETPGPST